MLGAGSAAAAEIHVLLGVDPADATGDVLLSASLAPAQSLSRATGSRTTITQTSTMAEVIDGFLSRGHLEGRIGSPRWRLSGLGAGPAKRR